MYMCYFSDYKYIAFFTTAEIYVAFFGKISFIFSVLSKKRHVLLSCIVRRVTFLSLIY